MRELMGEVKVGAVLQFPPVRLRRGELASLAPGAILRLPLPKHTDGGAACGRVAVWTGASGADGRASRRAD